MPLSRTHWAYSNAASRIGSLVGGAVALAAPTVESEAAVAAKVTANPNALITDFAPRQPLSLRRDPTPRAWS